MPHSPAAAVDADAVCGVCGNVNPEGTLICRTCGNNLRDQKYRRQSVDMEPFEPERINVRQVVRGVGAALALLIVLWTALNVDRIADAMVGASAPEDPLQRLFRAPDDEVYVALSDRAAIVTVSVPADLSQLQVEPLAAEGIAGNYVLVMRDEFGSLAAVGTAVVEQDGATARFVARLGDAAEIRGEATGQAGGAFQTTWNRAAVRDATGVLHGVAGVAVPQPDGSIECFGQTTLDNANYSVLAYRLP